MPNRLAEKYLSGRHLVHEMGRDMFSGGIPASISTMRLAWARSMWIFPVTRLRKEIRDKSNPDCRNVSATSSPTSKQAAQMHGPMMTLMQLGSAPAFIISPTVAAAMRRAVPFHPACAAPMTWLAPSASRIGTQSAVFMPMVMPDRVVTNASVSSIGATGMVEIVTTLVEWVCRGMTI